MTPHSIVKKQQSQDYINALKALNELTDFDHETPEVLWAMQKARQLTPIEHCVLSLMVADETMKHTGYIQAVTSEDLMFECGYLQSVLGKPPYLYATELGLNKHDIKEYQRQWKSVGIDPVAQSGFNKGLMKGTITK